jgi:glucosamine--fructose-6-phosphate aminotransferase (isomerizing)
MCGIVGYIGKKNAIPILLEGLKRLEYRGYDSAGIACVKDKKIFVTKAVGKISSLEKKAQTFVVSGNPALGHTRWATHGEVSEKNAHPHLDCQKKIAVVHNGIIENFAELKEKLEAKGHRFASETDTEVLAHLIEDHYKRDLKEAVRAALSEVVGTYGLAVISLDEPGKLVAARSGSPLVLGVGKGEYSIASDATALIPYTRRVVYIDEGSIITLTCENFETVTLNNKFIQKKIEKIKWDMESAEKKEFPHFMLKEIFEEPDVVRRALAGRVIIKKGAAHLGGLNMNDFELRKIKRILFIACGTAYYAGLVGKYMIEECSGTPCDVEFASELRYKNLILDPDTLIFVISQSGETADTIAAMREIQQKGFKVLGISNVVGSTIARESSGGVFIHAGPEIGVASTKAFLAQITVFAILALEFGRIKILSEALGEKIAKSLVRIPLQIMEILEKSGGIKKIAHKYLNYKNFLFLGRKLNYPIALEGALKLKEISYIHAEAYPAGEMKHGPIALIDRNFPTFAIVPRNSVYEKTINNLLEIKARKGKIIAIATLGDKKIEKIVDDVIFIPKTDEITEPLLTSIPCQLFAYHVATLKNLDVDKPRNLAKSVTVE